MVKWSKNNQGTFILPAIDTGQLTGMEFIENQADSDGQYNIEERRLYAKICQEWR